MTSSPFFFGHSGGVANVNATVANIATNVAEIDIKQCSLIFLVIEYKFRFLSIRLLILIRYYN